MNSSIICIIQNYPYNLQKRKLKLGHMSYLPVVAPLLFIKYKPKITTTPMKHKNFILHYENQNIRKRLWTYTSSRW